jgi:hypothetical protein
LNAPAIIKDREALVKHCIVLIVITTDSKDPTMIIDHNQFSDLPWFAQDTKYNSVLIEVGETTLVSAFKAWEKLATLSPTFSKFLKSLIDP